MLGPTVSYREDGASRSGGGLEVATTERVSGGATEIEAVIVEDGTELGEGTVGSWFGGGEVGFL